MNRQEEKRIRNQENLENRILHGLSCEWDRALGVLRPDERRKMRLPLFALSDSKDRWGTWRRDKREICLSRRLVWGHSWPSVREVLFHEMAHQMADEVFGACHEASHGPRFLEACHLLRANPKASGTYRPLDDLLRGANAGPEDRILLRVKKLMALAGSPNRHEAEAAMSRAQSLIAKYNLDLLSREAKRDFVSIFAGAPALRHFPEEYLLAHLLQDFYFVRGIWVSAYVREKGKMGRVLEISGTFANVKLAGYVYDFVRQFILSQWREYNRERGLNRYRLTDFAVGVIEGFRSKLESRQAGEGSTALVKASDPQLKKYLSYRYPHTATIRAGMGRQDMGVRRDGNGIGRKLVISKGIMEGARSRGLLLSS